MVKKRFCLLFGVVMITGCSHSEKVSTTSVQSSSEKLVQTTQMSTKVLQTESMSIRTSIISRETSADEKSMTYSRSTQIRNEDEQSSSSVRTETQVETTQTSESVTKTENNIAKADLSLGYLIIVNKKYALPADYEPSEDEDARVQLSKLITQMQTLGYDVGNSYSGYRSYYMQENVYNQYVNQHGREAADARLARPGHSEHQTGLAYDVKTTSGELLGDGNLETHQDAVNWLATHAHHFGFIIRYQAGKEYVTGYDAEPWHLRYVGSVEVATNIYQSGLSLEEYYGVSGGDYVQ